MKRFEERERARTEGWGDSPVGNGLALGLGGWEIVPLVMDLSCKKGNPILTLKRTCRKWCAASG